MRNRDCARRTGSLLVLVLVAVVLAGPSQAEQPPDDLELLRLVAAAHKDNLSRITTWTGKATSVGRYMDGPDRGIVQTSTIDFIFDEAQGKRWRWSVEEYVEIDGESMSPRPDMREERDEMLREDGFFEFGLGFRPKGSDVWQRVLVIFPVEDFADRFHPYSQSFDPMWYLSTIDDTPFQEMLLEYCNNIGILRIHGLRVIREGDLVTMERNWGGDVMDRYRFDLARGGNLVERHQSSNEGEWMTRLTYEQVDDVWCPKSYSSTTTQNRGDKAPLRIERQITFDEQKINGPVGKEEFTLEAMGVIPSTRVTDRRTNVFYEYGHEAETTIVATDDDASHSDACDVSCDAEMEMEMEMEMESPPQPQRDEEGLAAGAAIMAKTDSADDSAERVECDSQGCVLTCAMWPLAGLAGVLFLVVAGKALTAKRRGGGR